MGTVGYETLKTLLPETEQVRLGEYRGIPVILHNDHRWAVCLAQYVIEQKELQPPLTLVNIDAHHDLADPSCREALCALRSRATVSDVVDWCTSALHMEGDSFGGIHNANWIQAGMHLGIFGDVAMFGVRYQCSAKSSRTLSDCAGARHDVAISCGRPLFPFGPHGLLADNGSWRAETIRRIIGWEETAEGISLVPTRSPLLVSMDLDAFTTGAARRKTWQEGDFICEFGTDSIFARTRGWSGATFLRALISRAAVLVIAREPLHSLEPHSIMAQLDRHVFKGELRFE